LLPLVEAVRLDIELLTEVLVMRAHQLNEISDVVNEVNILNFEAFWKSLFEEIAYLLVTFVLWQTFDINGIIGG